MRLARFLEKLRDETSWIFSYIPYKPNCVYHSNIFEQHVLGETESWDHFLRQWSRKSSCVSGREYFACPAAWDGMAGGRLRSVRLDGGGTLEWERMREMMRRWRRETLAQTMEQSSWLLQNILHPTTLEVQGDPAGRLKPFNDRDLGCSAIMPGQ